VPEDSGPKSGPADCRQPSFLETGEQNTLSFLANQLAALSEADWATLLAMLVKAKAMVR